MSSNYKALPPSSHTSQTHELLTQVYPRPSHLIQFLRQIILDAYIFFEKVFLVGYLHKVLQIMPQIMINDEWTGIDLKSLGPLDVVGCIYTMVYSVASSFMTLGTSHCS